MAGFLRESVDDVRTVAKGWRWGRRPVVPRSAEEFVLPSQKTVFPTDWSRRRPARYAREAVQKGALEPVMRSQVRRHVEGLDVLSRIDGPVIFAANHASHLDTPLILLSLPDEWRRRTAVAAAADYFFDTWWRAVGSAIFFNTFPIDRRGGSMATTPGEVLADGWSLVIFPEGTRSKDGWVGRFQLGAAYLACQHGVPVVPVAHRGTFAAMPRGQGWPGRGRRQLTIRFGEPLIPGEDESPRDFSPGSAPASPPCSTRTRRPGGRPAAGRRPATPPIPPARRSPSGGGCGSRPQRWLPMPPRRRCVPGSGRGTCSAADGTCNAVLLAVPRVLQCPWYSG